MTNEFVTVAEIADVLGVAESVAVVLEGLEADGIAIVEDKLGQPAVSAKDAKRVVKGHYEQLAKLEAERQRQWQLLGHVADAQKARDEAFDDAYTAGMRAHPGGNANQQAAVRAAATKVTEMERDLPDEVRDRLVWRTPLLRF